MICRGIQELSTELSLYVGIYTICVERGQTLHGYTEIFTWFFKNIKSNYWYPKSAISYKAGFPEAD
jgi:hypothetical protein